MKVENRIRETMGLVPPALAEKLRDCGFDLDCAFCYRSAAGGDGYGVISAHGATDVFSIVKNSVLDTLDAPGCITAPTVDAAGEFIRTTYGMFVSVEPYGCIDAVRYRYRVWSLDESKFTAEEGRAFGGFRTPAEAACDGMMFVLEKILRL